MAEVKDKPLAHMLVEALARAWVASVPPENREALRPIAPRLIQETIMATLGCDSVQLTGWVVAPVERQARRERIVSALHAGEAAEKIASRELVSVQWVRRLRKAAPGETAAP